jgi:hypothetical protein
MDFAKLISYLFHSQTQTHVFHLQTQSYAEHKALQKYYEGVDELIDGLVEAYQGEYGIIKGYTNFNLMEYNNTQQVIAYLDALCKAVYATYETIEDSYILNLLDGITELIKSTIYKLQNLR